MQNVENKIAVITGAAKGIGRGLAEKAAALNMRLVLADIDAAGLQQTASELKAETFTVVTDVTDEDQVNALADKTVEYFGVPHLLFNNAGIGGYVGPLWELSTKKIRWVMDVNFMSVVHGIKAFVPMMIKNKEPSHIINTASMAGLYSFPYFSTYVISKHSVVALSECLYHDLKRQNANIGVSVLCPGGVNTQILEGSKEYPDVHKEQEFLLDYDGDDTRFIANFAKMVRKGITPEATAEMVFKAIEDNKFYILTHGDLKPVVKARMESILEETEPAMLDL